MDRYKIHEVPLTRRRYVRLPTNLCCVGSPGKKLKHKHLNPRIHIDIRVRFSTHAIWHQLPNMGLYEGLLLSLIDPSRYWRRHDV